MKHYYAVVSGYGLISIFSGYGQPTLHIFSDRKERDNFVYDNDVLNGNINHRVWKISSKEAKQAYGRICDGVFEFGYNVKHH